MPLYCTWANPQTLEIAVRHSNHGIPSCSMLARVKWVILSHFNNIWPKEYKLKDEIHHTTALKSIQIYSKIEKLLFYSIFHYIKWKWSKSAEHWKEFFDEIYPFAVFCIDFFNMPKYDRSKRKKQMSISDNTLIEFPLDIFWRNQWGPSIAEKSAKT